MTPLPVYWKGHKDDNLCKFWHSVAGRGAHQHYVALGLNKLMREGLSTLLSKTGLINISKKP